MRNVWFCYVDCHKPSSQIYPKMKGLIALPANSSIIVKSRGRQSFFLSTDSFSGKATKFTLRIKCHSGFQNNYYSTSVIPERIWKKPPPINIINSDFIGINYQKIRRKITFFILGLRKWRRYLALICYVSKKPTFNSMKMNVRPTSSYWKLKEKEKLKGNKQYLSFLSLYLTEEHSSQEHLLQGTEQITKMWIPEEMHGPTPHQLQGSTAVLSFSWWRCATAVPSRTTRHFWTTTTKQYNWTTDVSKQLCAYLDFFACSWSVSNIK